jgi:hypothetical protein
MSDNTKFLKVIDDAGLTAIDNDKLAADLKELTAISNSLPKDNVFSSENCLQLERQCIRGMNICDYWTPIVHIVMSEQESDRDMARNKAYLNAGQDGTKMTAEMRKAYSESDENFNKLKILAEKIKGIKLFFEKKRDTFKSAIFVFRDQLSSYKLSDKGNSGESLMYGENKKEVENW